MVLVTMDHCVSQIQIIDFKCSPLMKWSTLLGRTIGFYPANPSAYVVRAKCSKIGRSYPLWDRISTMIKSYKGKKTTLHVSLERVAVFGQHNGFNQQENEDGEDQFQFNPPPASGPAQPLNNQLTVAPEDGQNGDELADFETKQRKLARQVELDFMASASPGYCMSPRHNLEIKFHHPSPRQNFNEQNVMNQMASADLLKKQVITKASQFHAQDFESVRREWSDAKKEGSEFLNNFHHLRHFLNACFEPEDGQA